MSAKAPDVTNPYNCEPFLIEAITETLAGMDQHDRADLCRAIIRGDTLDWAQQLEKDVRDYMQDSAWEVGNV